MVLTALASRNSIEITHRPPEAGGEAGGKDVRKRGGWRLRSEKSIAIS